MMIADISHYQGTIDWDTARKNLEFCIFRSSLGAAGLDNKYVYNATECKIPFGVYHYVKAGTEAAAEQEAKHFYKTATQNGIRPLFFVADIEYETQTKTTTKPVCLKFAETLRTLGVKKIGLYIGQSKYPYIKDSLDKFDFLWIPRYGKNTGYADENYAPKYPCDLWQYTSKGSVEGIKGNNDLNKIYGDKPLEWFIEKEEEEMAIVKIGSARIDENGNAHGGKAGDQTGNEVGIQNWYKHSKNWRVLRAKDAAMAPYIAEAMKKACNNSQIGYDQYQNDTLWKNVAPAGYDPAKTTKAVETDCARLVRVCAQYACVKTGRNITVPDFYTGTLVSKLLSTGLFVELKGSKYTNQSDYLGMGDILCTATKGHTVVVLNNGDKYEGPVEDKEYELGERTLRVGDAGKDVEILQTYLLQLGYTVGSAGIDGDFGSGTEKAVKAFQEHENLEVDGIYGPKSHEILMIRIEEEQEPEEEDTPTDDSEVEIRLVVTGDSVRIRLGDSTDFAIYDTVKKNKVLVPVLDANGKPIISKNGWYAIYHNDQIAWISGKYIKVQ